MPCPSCFVGRHRFTDSSLLTAQTIPTALITPSFSRRMASWMYEGMLMFAVAFLADYLFSSLSQTRHALDNRHAQQAFLFVVFGIYFVWFWYRGQTLAMKTWHIRVVDIHGRALTQPRALLRYVLSWMWFLPPLAASWALGLSAMQGSLLALAWVPSWMLLAHFHPQKQFWHDAWAGTQLIHWLPPGKAAKAAKK